MLWSLNQRATFSAFALPNSLSEVFSNVVGGFFGNGWLKTFHLLKVEAAVWTSRLQISFWSVYLWKKIVDKKNSCNKLPSPEELTKARSL